ncbi:hypothetical protein MVEN_01615700 [Mycena venus]|uniref:Uncharacterized protein n=1 Tax=Mycena venus TaxID=2733690 RepID=A0A8H6XT25_9AGAR|nr:hypothetical protein MVEN_01615700 [Mycena venus]
MMHTSSTRILMILPCIWLALLAPATSISDTTGRSTFIIPVDGASPTWALPMKEVLMDVQNTNNYQLKGSEADAQWDALIPPGGGLVRMGPENELFMLSMYHQLKCLDIIRRDYVDGWMGKNDTSPVTRHCLNYIRQMILCRGDRRLECVVDPDGAHAVEIRGTQTCRDWTQVYDGVREYTGFV